MINKAIFLLPAAILMQALPSPKTLEGVFYNLLEQSPMLLLIVYLWTQDSKRRDKQQIASEKRYEALVETVVEAMQQRVECPVVEKMKEDMQGNGNS